MWPRAARVALEDEGPVWGIQGHLLIAFSSWVSSVLPEAWEAWHVAVDKVKLQYFSSH